MNVKNTRTSEDQPRFTGRRLSSKRTRHRRHASSRCGASLVEFAFVVPVFVVILFSCLEFARLNMIRNLVQDAAYYSCRHCFVPGATEQEAIDEATRILDAMGTQGVSVTINDGNGLDENSDEITVRITVPIGDNALIVSQFTNEMEIVAETTMRTERYDGYYDAN
ncbi:MAG: TadE/TadG family type IV pilus assembly protein [Planctomycetota bacterium]